jgi:DNA-binding NarL/FixJ family response regulator
MKTKAIPTPSHVEPPAHEQPVAGQVAMVVMLVPIPTPPAEALQAHAEAAHPRPYVDSHDHVWLVVDKASPIAAVLQQITAAEPLALTDSSYTPPVPNGMPQPDPPPSAPAFPEPGAIAAEPLSRRELDVLRLMANGQSNQEIAQTLILAISTIKMHIKHIYGKLGVRNRVQALAQARSRGILTTAMRY